MTICLQDRGERQRLARIKKRAANMANCRTSKCLALDTDAMEEALDVSKDRPASLPDRIFLTLFTPLPCHACEKLRNMGEGLLLSCQCTFQQLRGPDATYTVTKDQHVTFADVLGTIRVCFSTVLALRYKCATKQLYGDPLIFPSKFIWTP